MTAPTSVTVQLFASLKDAARSSSVQIPISQPLELSAFLEEIGAKFPVLAPWLPYVRVAVNREYAHAQTQIRAGDEVALIPPVSGGSDELDEENEVWARVVEAPLSLDDVVRAVQERKGGAAGAICTFLGVVRENSRDLDGQFHDDIEFLDYEAYEPMARSEIEKICREVETKFEAACAIFHRVGRLNVGEASVAIAVATAHRGASFEACRYAIEALKKDVPIWKKETARDGFWWQDRGAA